ncbi:MAG: hypothetical protein AAB480_04940 [Patescibacteria group bacterium]
MRKSVLIITPSGWRPPQTDRLAKRMRGSGVRAVIGTGHPRNLSGKAAMVVLLGGKQDMVQLGKMGEAARAARVPIIYANLPIPKAAVSILKQVTRKSRKKR